MSLFVSLARIILTSYQINRCSSISNTIRFKVLISILSAPLISSRCSIRPKFFIIVKIHHFTIWFSVTSCSCSRKTTNRIAVSIIIYLIRCNNLTLCTRIVIVSNSNSVILPNINPILFSTLSCSTNICCTPLLKSNRSNYFICIS